MIEILNPRNEVEWLTMRREDITSTEVSALFDCSPYITKFELWHRKKNAVEVEFKGNERVVWGQRLESAIAEGIAQDENWTIRHMTEYIRDKELRLGASFDYEFTTKNLLQSDRISGILEVKNVDSLAFRDGWIVDGEHVEAPLHIEFQAQQQLMLSKKPISKIGALIGGNRIKLLTREPDPVVHEAIRTKVAEFWKSIKENNPPEPDMAKDATFVISMNQFANPGKIFNAVGNVEIENLADFYKLNQETESMAKKQKEKYKAQLLLKIGDAEKVILSKGSISAGMIGPTRIEAYDREGFRSFRVNYKKEPK